MSREYGSCENHEKMYEMAISNNRKVNVVGKESVELGLDHQHGFYSNTFFFSPQNFIELRAWFFDIVPHKKCLLSTLYRERLAVLFQRRRGMKVSLIEQVLQTRHYVRHFIIFCNQL